MKKALCVLVVLASVALAASFGIAGSSSVPPVIVASGRFVNRTEMIPQTLLAVPKHDALYRVSVYATITRPDPNSQSLWSYLLMWTDGSGQLQEDFIDGNGSQAGHFCSIVGCALGGRTDTVAVSVGKPLTFAVTRSGPPDNSAYSLYYTVEQLQ
jgi:hypothetical protein